MGFLDVLDEVESRLEDGVIKVARESISTEKEKEYCLWVKPTVEGWDWLYKQQGECFIDVLMPIAQGKRRVRIRSGSAVLTLKTYQEGVTEENSDIGFATALTFYADEYLCHLVRRIRMDAGELTAKGAKHWDIDVFYRYQGHPELPDQQAFDDIVATAMGGTSYGDWVKVELEVERYELESIREFLPFEIEEALPGRPQNEEDGNFLRDYWDNVTRL